MDQILDGVMQDLKDTQEVLTIPGGTRIDIVLCRTSTSRIRRPSLRSAMTNTRFREKDRQQLYRTAPQAIMAGAEGGAVEAPAGAQKIMMDGKEFWLIPAKTPAEEDGRDESAMTMLDRRSERAWTTGSVVLGSWRSTTDDRIEEVRVNRPLHVWRKLRGGEWKSSRTGR